MASSNSSSSTSKQQQGNNSTNNTTGTSSSRILAAKETFSTLHELSKLLNTGLDAESLALCVQLCENGANPEALAVVIKEIRREAQSIGNDQ